MDLSALVVIWTLHAVYAEIPLKSALFPKENITDYHTFTPTVVYRSSDKKYPDVMWISVAAEGYNFTLKLKINRDLISSKFISKHYKPNNVEVVSKNHSNCFYQGTSDEFPTWVAVMSMCRGLRGSFEIHSKGNQINIEPLNRQDKTLNQRHALYLRDKEDGPARCGTSHKHAIINDFPPTNTTRKVKRLQSSGNYVIELLVVNDWSQLQKFGGDVQSAVMRAAEIVNGIDSLFAALGIRVVLAQVITWTDGDRITTATSPSVLLDNFSGYKPNVTVRYNAALLFTGQSMDSETIGIAYVNTMCSSNLAVGVVRDYSSAVSVSSTASHELGHILSMVHDTGNCQCNDTKGCIMTQEIRSQPPIQWSSCSVNSLVVGLRRFSSCLYKQNEQTMQTVISPNAIQQNTPTSVTFAPPLVQPSPTTASKSTDVKWKATDASPTIPVTVAVAGVPQPNTGQEISSPLPNIQPSTTTSNPTTVPTMLNSPTTSPWSPTVNVLAASTCGNGIRESNEACDCGPTKVCKDPCCDPTTCQLIKGTQCNSGVCCIGCYFARASVMCRASNGECDVAEYCTGSSPDCPQGVFVRDGASCAKGAAYCYNGSCLTRDAQCKALYGSSGGDGDSSCYKQYNNIGTVVGNCGVSKTGSYMPCSDSNVLCGSLQCSNAGSMYPAVNNALGVTYMGTRHPCKSFVYALYGGLKNNIWVVKNGTKCGINKVCISGQCTDILSVACPKGENGVECSGKGVCLNNGTCSCSPGNSGSTCS